MISSDKKPVYMENSIDVANAVADPKCISAQICIWTEFFVNERPTSIAGFFQTKAEICLVFN